MRCKQQEARKEIIEGAVRSGCILFSVKEEKFKKITCASNII